MSRPLGRHTVLCIDGNNLLEFYVFRSSKIGATRRTPGTRSPTALSVLRNYSDTWGRPTEETRPPPPPNLHFPCRCCGSGSASELKLVDQIRIHREKNESGSGFVLFTKLNDKTICTHTQKTREKFTKIVSNLPYPKNIFSIEFNIS